MGQIVVIISGFIIPRQIDASLGPTTLGIWDFGWSTVSYFRLFGFGLAGGLNRFVAVYNAEEAEQKLRRAVSSTVFMTIIISLVVAAAAVGLASILPSVFDTIPPEEINQSQILIVFFGATVAYRMLCWPARSILTGYHLTTITSMVTAAGDLLLLFGLFGVLMFGGGLAELGVVVLVSSVFAETTRVFMARRVYDGPILERASLDRKMMGKMFKFGMKNNITGLPHIVIIQTTSILLAATAGPAALAVFSRPLALANLIGRLVRNYTSLLTPVAGSMHGLKRHDDLKEFLLSSLRVSVAMTTPMLLLFGAYGDIVIEIWMNEDYVVPWLCPLMSIAFFLPISHSAAMRILAGADAHGRVAIRSLVLSSLVFAVALVIALATGLNVISAAIITGLGMSVGPGIVVIAGACKRFDVGILEYLRHVLLPPLYCNVPLLAVVLVSRVLYPGMSLPGAVLWGSAGGAVVLLCYWRFLLSDDIREDLSRRIVAFVQGRKA
jgi:O-antigen/teichoic acid export membrane protein